MILYILHAFALVTSVAAGYTEISHNELNGAHLIETGSGNYAIASQTFAGSNWKTVSVNGNELIATSPTCQSTVKLLDALSDAEKTMIQSAKNQLEFNNSPNIERPANAQFRYSTFKYSPDGTQISSTSFGSNHLSSYQNNGFSMAIVDDNNFSLARPGMVNNMAHLFVSGDLMTIVYTNGSIRMKPMACLTPEEQQVIRESRLLVRQAEEQSQQNMLNLQLNMQNMRQNLQNQFANGFPFNQANNGHMMNPNFAMNQYQQPFQQQQQQQINSFGIGGIPLNYNYANNYAPPPNMFNPFANNFMRPVNQYQPFGQQFPFGNINGPFPFG